MNEIDSVDIWVMETKNEMRCTASGRKCPDSWRWTYGCALESTWFGIRLVVDW